MDNYPNGYQNRPLQNWNGGQNSYLGNYQTGQMAQTGGQMQGNFNQSMPQMVQQAMIPGRMVNSLDDVVPGEVPMNGNPTYFPTADGEMIYMLRWTREGKIEPTPFVRQRTDVPPMNATVSNDEIFQTIMTRLDEMQKEIKRISRPRHRNQSQKKEESTNE